MGGFLLVLGVLWIGAMGYATPRSGCSITKILGMRSADCYDKKLTAVPTNLPSNIEVIDLSFNRIRKIEETDLKKFSSLKHLYLQDNMISKIDDHVFDNQDDLTTLDISLNGIISLPPVIFQLPSLRNLYLSRNLNINLAETIEKAKPIKSPLTKLDISNNELETLPDLGTIPTLVVYNISGNGELTMTPSHFAGLCNLQILDNTNVSAVFFNQCDCYNIESWLKERQVRFTPFDCDRTLEVCVLSEDDLTAYNQCKEQHKEIQFQASVMKIGLPVAGGTALVILIVLIYFIRRCRRKAKTYAKGEKTEGLMQFKN